MSSSAPMGYVDTIDVGDKKLTIQTEYYDRPKPRGETKVYLGGALKKIYTEDFSSVSSSDRQKALADFHHRKKQEIVAGLKQKADSK